MLKNIQYVTYPSGSSNGQHSVFIEARRIPLGHRGPLLIHFEESQPVPPLETHDHEQDDGLKTASSLASQTRSFEHSLRQYS